MDNIHQDHKAAITPYYTTLNVDKTLKKQLVKTIHPIYMSALRQPLLGLTNIACLQVIQHLDNQYGRVSPAMLYQADAKL
eukprot:12972959-Ditylum_brightwellii.AAC.2